MILDGATGTYIQGLHFTEQDFRGTEFRDHPLPLMGCNDVLCLTQPQAVIQMHLDYIHAGADFIETNSFNTNAFSLADYGLQDHVYTLALAAAQCVRTAVERSGRDVVVCGCMGPTSKTASISADVNNPAARDVTFADLYATYHEQARGLMDGGVDVYLIETAFDTLNVKAAIKAITDLAEEAGRDLPIMVSGTISDASGRTLSGQTMEAFVASISHAPLLSVGLNCGFGATQLLPHLRCISHIAPCPVSVHPNAGLPNVMGEYDETPQQFADLAAEFFKDGLVNIYGGCCGTTPEHIRQLAHEAANAVPRPIDLQDVAQKKQNKYSTLSGLEPLRLDRSVPFLNIGERTNVAGSAKFKRLVKEGQWEEALSVARHQVDNGANIIDICMDDGMIDGVQAMRTFLNLIASEPAIARVPVMIDSSKWEILQAGLQCVQGKSIVNSISLKEGEARFLEKARYIHSMGAAAVVMLFDEQGQADSYERKVALARRAYSLLKDNGFPTEDIIFDPNVLAVATGMPEHDDYGRAFIEACRTIHREMPEVHLSGGISNLSFSFRGNNTIRQAMHSVVLHHAIAAGLDMSIVNPAMTMDYDSIPADLLKAVEDVVLNRDSGAAERLIDFAQQWKAREDAMKAGTDKPSAAAAKADDWRALPLKQRIDHAMLNGLTDFIGRDAEEAYREAGSALAVIDDYLMPAMEHVGELFGEGKMFLPQVVKSARVMKKAVAQVEPYMRFTAIQPATSALDGAAQPAMSALDDAVQPATSATSATQHVVVMATVKGDVHDIGKNIVGVVIQCNGYEVRDLGVMVEPQLIVDTAVETGAVCIGLSGLITPSLDEMIHVVQMLQSRGLTIPVMVGGATTSELHTAVKIAPEYPDGVVFHCRAAADNPALLRHLVGDDREDFIRRHKERQQQLREQYLREEAMKKPPLTLGEAQRRRTRKDASLIAVPSSQGRVLMAIDNRSLRHPKGACLCCDPLVPLINWHYFFSAWGLKGHFPEVLSDPAKGDEATRLYRDAQQLLEKIIRHRLLRLQLKAHILPARSEGDDVVITGTDGKERRLTMPRSLRDEPVTQCLADHITADGRDWVCPFVVSAGVGLNDLQRQFRNDGDEYHAIMAKLLADRLTEAMSEKLQHDLVHTVRWAPHVIAMAFGYPSCPDHSLKRQVLDLLDITPDNSGLSLTESNMIDPSETICGLIFANSPVKYFVV